MNIEQQLKGLEIKQSTTTLRADFEYLDDNINWYLIDEAILVTEIAPGLQYGTVNLKQFLLWSIWDIIAFVIIENHDEDDVNFVKTDSRVKRIIRKYGLKESIEKLL